MDRNLLRNINVVIYIYWEFYETIESAIEREKHIKKWKRAWKDKLITQFNPIWRDLYNEILEMN